MSFRKRFIFPLINTRLMQAILYNPLTEFHQFKLLRFVKRIAIRIGTHEKLLDIGAGELKYRRYFSNCQYISNDLGVGDSEWIYNNIDIVSPAENIPVADASFDHILCTQVLEHIETPDRVFAEFNRILKINGMLYLSVPLSAIEHQVPYDYFRYTRYGLESLGRRFGFEILSVEPHGGIFINIENMIWCAFWLLFPAKRFSWLRYIVYFLLLPIKATTGLLAVLIDPLDRIKNYTINYNFVYRKIDSRSPDLI